MAAIKVGIIGTGGMANAHAYQFNQIAGVKLHTVYDIDTAKAQAFVERRSEVNHVSDSVDELIDRCDAVAIVTPDRTHANLAVATLKAGRHLLCEKPLTVTVPEARKVVKAWRQAGVVGMTNFSHRTDFDFVEAQRLVAEGFIGAPRYVRSHYLQGILGLPGARWKTPAMLWRMQTARGSGGVLTDIGCHITDFSTGVTGDVSRLRCTFRTQPKIDETGAAVTNFKGKLDSHDTCMVEMDFTNGAYGRMEASRWATGYGQQVELEIHGTEGAIACGHNNDGPWLRVFRSAGKNARQWVDGPRKKRYPNNWQRFIRAIKTGTTATPDLHRGAVIQTLLDAAQRSVANDGAWTKPTKIA